MFVFVYITCICIYTWPVKQQKFDYGGSFESNEFIRSSNFNDGDVQVYGMMVCVELLTKVLLK